MKYSPAARWRWRANDAPASARSKCVQVPVSGESRSTFIWIPGEKSTQGSERDETNSSGCGRTVMDVLLPGDSSRAPPVLSSRREEPPMAEKIEIGFQAFVSDGGEEFGAI